MPARNQIDGVIYDFGPNMFGKTAALSLATLINTTRHLTNSDTAAIVAWPRLDNKQDLRQSVLAAEMAHATLIEVEHNRSLYFDAVHPNLKGHAEIARAVDQYLRSASGLSSDVKHLFRRPEQGKYHLDGLGESRAFDPPRS